MLKFVKGIILKSSSEHGAASDEDEPDRPPTKLTAVIVILSFMFLLAVGLVAYTVLWKTTAWRLDTMDTGMANVTRLDYIKKQEELLTNYKKLDDGHYQIPINKAMDLVIKEQGSN